MRIAYVRSLLSIRWYFSLSPRLFLVLATFHSTSATTFYRSLCYSPATMHTIKYVNVVMGGINARSFHYNKIERVESLRHQIGLNRPAACWQWANDASSSLIFRILSFAPTTEPEFSVNLHHFVALAYILCPRIYFWFIVFCNQQAPETDESPWRLRALHLFFCFAALCFVHWCY